MKGRRVVVQLGKKTARKFGTVMGESRDGKQWIVLLDGRVATCYVRKSTCEWLKPEQLAFHWGK